MKHIPMRAPAQSPVHLQNRWRTHGQLGASLIEVLVAILLLSFGMLSLGGMLAYAVQMPKLAGNRAMAVALASGHIERMRSNVKGFTDGNYDENLSYNNTLNLPSLSDCAYPDCTTMSLATMDTAYTNRLLRKELPAGGMRVERDTASGPTDGNLWIIWNEPATFAALNPTSSDNCPSQVADFVDPKPRCLYVRFKL